MSTSPYGSETSSLRPTERAPSWPSLHTMNEILILQRNTTFPIQRVLVMEEGGDAAAPMNKAEIEHGWMVNSPMDGFDGLYGQAAKDAVCQALEKRSRGHQTINWKIRPWLISRQRYWGTPIPVIHCGRLRCRPGAG